MLFECLWPRKRGVRKSGCMQSPVSSSDIILTSFQNWSAVSCGQSLGNIHIVINTTKTDKITHIHLMLLSLEFSQVGVA